MDQSINKIVLEPTTEDSASKVEKLEKEVMILKGSIKKLIVDIREQMNNTENPFLNIQQLQMPAQAPVIKEDPIEFELPKAPGQEEEEETEEKPAAKGRTPKKSPGRKEQGQEHDHEKGRKVPDDSCGIETMDFDRPLSGEQGYSRRDVENRHLPGEQGYSRRDVEMINEFEEQKRMLSTMRDRTRNGGPTMLTGARRIDPYTINQIMDWTRTMLRKNGSERLMDLLEMYVSTGYISEETKAIIQRMSKLMESEPTKPPKKLEIRECVSDLYALYIILNPGDKDLDSRMLNVLLNADDRY